MKDAKDRFKKDKTRTIILINEFDNFAPKNSEISGALKDKRDNFLNYL